MFTGLIETVGTVRSLQWGDKSVSLGIRPDRDDYHVASGGSVAIDGVCLTLESTRKSELLFTAVSETLKRSTLAQYQVGDRVNCERALCLQDRLEGHIVLGHVDGIGRIVSDRPVGNSLLRTIKIPGDLRRFIAEKGSIAVDGISLTIAESGHETVTVSLIPHTLRQTTMAEKQVGATVNIECDILARYIFQQARAENISDDVDAPAIREKTSILSLLEQNGF